MQEEQNFNALQLSLHFPVAKHQKTAVRDSWRVPQYLGIRGIGPVGGLTFRKQFSACNYRSESMSHIWRGLRTKRCYGFCQNGREPDELLPDLILATVSVIEMTNLATVPTNRNAFWQLSPKFRFFWHFWQPSQTIEMHSGNRPKQ